MKYKAIIFDMDGTIVDTNNIWVQATDHVLSSRGITLTQKQEQELREKVSGLSIHESCKIVKDIAQLPESVEQLIIEKQNLADNLYEQGISFIPGFAQFHAQLAKHKLKTGVATNASASTVRVTNKVLKLEQFFGTHIYNVNDVNNICKPDPTLYLHTAKKLGVNPDQCVVIEDSTYGVQAAKNAGMFCIGINTAKDRESIKKADIIIEGYDEINLKNLLKNR